MVRLAIPLVALASAMAQPAVKMEGGSYAIRVAPLAEPVVTARVGAKIDGAWVYSTEYLQHLGDGQRVVHTGLAGKPDLICAISPAPRTNSVSVQLGVQNRTSRTVNVEAIRLLDAIGARPIKLGGPDSANRVYSDSYSENRPVVRIYEFGKAPGGMHRGCWSQLVYNRESKQSLFIGALTAGRMVTMFHLSAKSFTVDSTGTTEVQKFSTLQASPPEDQLELNLPIPPGQGMDAEPIMIMAGPDYHAQLETYGRVIRDNLRARVDAPNLIGWWTWTALYSAISESTLRTNAQWLSEHLLNLGYEFFHIDEGYMYARGEYTTPDAARFPHGVLPLAHQIGRLGLKMGLWTAPFEVSMRSLVYEQHKDWLVHNAKGEPIQLGREITNFDKLYALDTTHPGAQEYLRETYRTVTREWGVRYIKLDFMDDTTVEGYYHRPHTTALEAFRIGLGIIRETVGDDVLLDKDGSPMLPAVGYTDTGRISVDTAHEFARTRSAGPGIAARYYMHRNFFINDPDAFCVARQLIGEVRPYTKTISLGEAEVSIALSAVSGGMFEIGDDLPSLGADRDRLALVENKDLLRMAKLSKAATPVDLMSYAPEDQQPSIFVLKEDRRHTTAAIFNWTDQPRSHRVPVNETAGGPVSAYDVFDRSRGVRLEDSSIVLDNQPPHSVRMIRLTNEAVPAAAPTVTVSGPASAEAGDNLSFQASVDPGGVPALDYRWDFGDGVTAQGRQTTHAYTVAGDYAVALTAEGVDGIPARKSLKLRINGTLHTPFPLGKSRRYSEK